jgi:PKD repeat protein
MSAYRPIVTAFSAATALLATSAVAYAAPVPIITASPSSGTAPLTVTLDATHSTADPGQTITAIAWDLGNGVTATTPTATTTYTGPGTYHVNLTITESNGQTATTTGDIPVGAAAPPTFGFAAPSLVYGHKAHAAGAFPGAARARLVIERAALHHKWKIVRRDHTDGNGAFTTTFLPTSGGVYRARLTKVAATSPAAALAVLPTIQIVDSSAFAFAGATATIRVAPASYTGKVTFAVSLAGKITGRETKRASKGEVTITVPTTIFGRYRLVATASPSGGLGGATTTTVVRAEGRTVSPGSEGPDIRFLRARLADLQIYVPGVSSTYSWQLYDSVIAFQKAYGFGRTGTVDAQQWRKLVSAHVVHARYTGSGHHIEVDQGRQIGMYVENGVVTHVWPVSTGAGGGTPNGTFAVYRKSTYDWDVEFKLWLPYASYIHNGIALHGFDSVPTYPASHGCIRIPQWIAPKVYGIDPVGEIVRIYS